MSSEVELPENGAEVQGKPDSGTQKRVDGRSPNQEPSWATAALLLIGVAFLYLVRGILAPFVIAGALAYALTPAVAWLKRRTGLPRVAVVALVFLFILGPLGTLIWLVEPRFVQETRQLGADSPDILRSVIVQLFGGEGFEFVGATVDSDTVTRYILSTLRDMMGNPTEAFRVAARVVETILSSFLALVLLFYFLVDPGPFGRGLLRLVPVGQRAEWQAVAAEIHEVMGRYVRGLLFLVALMSAVNWAGLALIFHLPYALPIAIAGGFLEIIPFLGPVLAASIAVAVGLSQGGASTAIGLIVFYTVVRQIEDQVVMPTVLGRAVKLHPAVNIFAVLAGGALWGVLGALLGIPVAAALKVAFDRWRPA